LARNSAGYESPAALAVDVVMLTVRAQQLSVLTVKTGAGTPALPGGFVGRNEEPHDAALRKLTEKTGLEHIYLEQLATFGSPHRDPRGWIPTVAHLALVPPDTEPSDPAASWISATAPPRLAYDHEQILEVALDRTRGKLWWSNIAVGVLDGEFTLTEARSVYEAITGATYDPSTFARDLRATGLISPTGNERAQDRGRPATLYRYAQQQPVWGAGRRKRVHR
jgi:8-oxo-dGTP diphosphatase